MATAWTLKFLLNQSKMQLPAMAETGWDGRTICFTRSTTFQLPMEAHPDGDFSY